MYIYRKDRLFNYLNQILQRSITQDGVDWLAEKTFQIINGNTSELNTAFTAAPRKVGKAVIDVSEEEKAALDELLPGFTLQGYTSDRLARMIVLLNWPETDRDNYVKAIGTLFKAAEMNELIALYGALPVLAYPDAWIPFCQDGIRSNIGGVLEAIICNNPYPAQYLPEPAWNQLVLKAFFTDKDIDTIVGLDRRANQPLAYTLLDYAHERWAAGRTFDVQLWRVLSKFIDERILPDLKRVLETGARPEREAVALACLKSSNPDALTLLDQYTDLKKSVETNDISWGHLARASKAL